jgi:hypothetical protein
MQEPRMVKAIHSWKPISKRPTERQKICWENDVKKHIQKLKLQNWRILVQDRNERSWLRRPKLCIKSCRAIINNNKKKIWVQGTY